MALAGAVLLPALMCLQINCQGGQEKAQCSDALGALISQVECLASEVITCYMAFWDCPGMKSYI